MPELTIHVPSYIGPSYLQESEDGWFCEWVQGITKDDVEMQVRWSTEILGQPVESILLEISTCDGGSTIEGFAIYNYLRSLGVPIRTKILALAASMAVPLALAADEGPEMDYTAQLMLHSASFNGGVYAETSAELRAQADRLDNTNQLLTDLLIARTGQSPETVAEWMSKDTWLTATQAKAVGLCGKVNPLTPKLTPVEADTLITARRKRATETMARADKRTFPATPAAAAAPTPAPMATTSRPTPRTPAAAKPAAPAPKARKSFWQSLKEFAQQGADEDEAEASAAESAEPTAETQSTVLAGDNGTLYHNGPLAVEVVVYVDEALTDTADPGDYDTADSQTITVGENGVVTAINPTLDATAMLTQRVDQLEASLTTERAKNSKLESEVTALKKLKPALPQPNASRARVDVPDPKNKAKATPTATHHAQL